MPVTPDFKTRLGAITKRNKTWKNAKRNYLPGTPYPEEAWLDAVTQYLILGNIRLVAASTGIPYDVLRKWRYTPKWKEIEAELRSSQNLEMDNTMTEIVEKTLTAIHDRVENGDFVWDQKNSQIVRRPAQLKDLQKVATDLLGKREMLRDNTTKRNEQPQSSTEDTLKLLAREFAKLVDKDKRTIASDVVDVEMVEIVGEEDAFHEEWEAGLQEGTPMGEESSSEPGTRSSGEECSSEGTDEEGRGSEG
jgi:hypothetical protein